MTPRDEISDPHALAIRAIVSGETLQDSTTANLIFGIDDVIAYASQTTTLEPGDLILTGTPAGSASSVIRSGCSSRETR